MRILVIGGGPAGLYFSILMKRIDPSHDVTLIERDGPNDTFGWGIVFSDQTFSYLKDRDESSYARIVESCQIWNNVDIVHRGEKVTIGGNKFSGISRLAFLQVLHARCEELGVHLTFHSNCSDLSTLPAHDLLVAADGARSTIRSIYKEAFKPSVEVRKNKYIWLGTSRLFNGLTLTFRENEAGVFAAHSYKFSQEQSTFIVECGPDTWARAGFEHRSESDTCSYLERVFRDDLEGRPLLTNNFVKWLNFLLVKNRHWHHERVVLIGDALRTAHFSIGSGTKLALDDSIALASAFEQYPDVEAALPAFEASRRPAVETYQDAAYESLSWFENMHAYQHLEPLALAYSLMTRSWKIDRDKLRMRDPEFVARYEALRGPS